MDKASVEVQTTETTSHQDIEHSDELLDDLRILLFPDRIGLYDGPGALTAREIQEGLKLNNHENARARARKTVAAGKMVEVRVLRVKDNGGEYVTTAWVMKAEYDKWMGEQDKQHDGRQYEPTGD